MTYDAIVVGSGFGGAITAFRLASAGKRVLVLERGPRLGHDAFVHTQDPRHLLRFFTRYQSVFLGSPGNASGAPPGPVSPGGLDVLTGSLVGGGSVVYSGVSLRAPSFVFERRDASGRRLWPSTYSRASLDPYYETVEANLPVNQLRWRSDDEPWREVPRRGGAWAAAMKAAGYTCLPIRQAVTDCLHCGWCNVGCRFRRKNDLLLNYIPWAEAAGAEVRAGLEVQTVASRPGGGYVVTALRRSGPGPAGLAAGPPETFCAEVVVLAAGAIGSTLLLMRSRPLLGPLSPQLGRNISGNADLPLGAFLPMPTDVYRGVVMDTVSFDFLRPETDGPHAADKFIIVTQHMLPFATVACGDEAWGVPDAWGLGRKRLFSRFGAHFVGLAIIGLDDQEGVLQGPEVQPAAAATFVPLSYAPSAFTRAVWRRATEVCRGVVEDAGGVLVDVAAELPNPQTAHPLGGCRMAEDPADGVVSPDCEVHGNPGLFVIDGSVIPSALGVNPSLTIAAVAERAAQRLAGRL